MALVQKNDVNQIFAEQAPSIDKPARFSNYPYGWGVTRPNNGKPTIKEFNYLQQRTDQNILWIHQNGAGLPYDENIEYADEAVVLKDGELQQLKDGQWKPTKDTDVIKTVESIADLIAIKNPKDGQVVYVKGYYRATNFALAQPFKGGGTRIYVESRKEEDDSFLCVKGWVLYVKNNTASPEHAGAKVDDSSFDSSDSIQKIIDADLCVSLLDGVYYTRRPIRYYDDTKIFGLGKDVSFISKIGTETSNNIDSVLLADPSRSAWSPTVARVDFNDFKLTRLNPFVGYGLYAEGLCLSTFKNFAVDGCRDGVHIVDSWMNTWNQCTSSHGKPWFIERGTSNSFVSCWATDVMSELEYGEDVFAWDIGGEYHTMISCGADRVGLEGQPATAVWNFTRGNNITATSLAGEILHTRRLMNVANTSVTVNNIFTWKFYNKYGTSGNFGYFEIESGASVDIQNGKIEVEYTSDNIPNDHFKPIFATLRNSSVFKVGALMLTDKITGIADNSATMIDHDGSGTIEIDGQTKFVHVGELGTQRTLDPNFKGIGFNNLQSILLSNRFIFGKIGDQTTPTIKFHSAGFLDKTNAFIQAYGGSETELGTLQISASTFETVAEVNYITGAVKLPDVYTASSAQSANVTIQPDGTLSRSTSSLKYKEDVKDVNLKKSFDVVMRSRPISYKPKDTNTDNRHYGLIAEEVLEIDSMLVHLDNGVAEGVAYDRYVPHLINAIKLLSYEIEYLKGVKSTNKD